MSKALTHDVPLVGTTDEQPEPHKKSRMEGVLDVIERVGNKVPHPAVIFVILIGIVILLSQLFHMMGTSVTYQAVDPETHQVGELTVAAQSLLTAAGIRFMYERVVQNFMDFNAVGVIIVAMLGVGVADSAGLVGALIRKLVMVAPRQALTYILVFVGILSSIAADAGYLVLIPLAATAFLSIGRHPLAGLAASFAGVAAVFTVNILIKPLDGILTEITNDAIHLLDPGTSIELTANFWFSIASVIMLTFVVSLITDRFVEPRLGKYVPEGAEGAPAAEGGAITPAESRGLKYAFWALIGVLAVFALLSLPSGAPLRNPDTGALIGNSPLMNGLIVLVTIVFLATGLAYGIGAGTIKGITDVTRAMEKAVAGLGGLIFLLFIISQFLALFNYTNLATIAAVKVGDVLDHLGLGALPLLIGFCIVVSILDLIMTGAIPKWAIFAPVFVPLLMRLHVKPEAVLAAYRVGDGPFNAISPLNAYFALIVTFAQKYQKSAGVGTVVALMLPYVVVVFGVWIVLLGAWQVLGLPWGL
jgi:aminobenzoyl-glutamate transport protein